MLFVGSIFNRRHVVDLIRAFAEVARAHPDASLDIAGDNRSYPHEDVAAAIAREQVGHQIRWHQYVSDEQLADLYQRARAFAFLSEYEGLGLTPLEALDGGRSSGAPRYARRARDLRRRRALRPARQPPGDHAGDREPSLRRRPRARDSSRRRQKSSEKYSWPRAGRETLAVIEQSA